jgi:hypothetical protein
MRITVLLAALSLAGCVTSAESDVAVQDAPLEDGEYGPALAKATQTRTIFKDWETRYTVTATYLSPAFRAAFSRRLGRVYKKDMPEFEEAGNKAGFFVSIQSPTDERTDLTNPTHWTVLMQSKGGAGPGQGLKPVLVKKLNDKERWRAFFATVTPWTSEYLVVFDAPSVDANSPELVEKTGISLLFANADAQVNLSW